MTKTQVFIDHNGNRFIFPSLIVDSEDDNSKSGAAVIMEAMMLSLSMGHSVKLEPDWLEIDMYNFPHVSIEIHASCFFHGAATVYAFAGPLFDEVANETALQKG